MATQPYVWFYLPDGERGFDHRVTQRQRLADRGVAFDLGRAFAERIEVAHFMLIC
jgi:hypothetical protein